MRTGAVQLLRGLSLLLSLVLLLSAPGQCQVVQEGTLQNGVGVTVAILQGDSHYWNFLVLPGDPNTGTALTDLVVVLSDSDGQTALYVTDVTGTRYSSSLASPTNGLLFTNQTDPATNGLRTGVSGFIQYGVYSIQVYGISADTYTLSATLSQRTVLTSGQVTQLQGPLSVVGGAASAPSQLDVGDYQYAQFVVQQSGPVQLTVAMTVDDAAVAASGTPLTSLVLPVVSWSSVGDVTPWAQSTSAWQSSNAAAPGQSTTFSLTSAFSECNPAPCMFSFLIAPQQVGLPVMPLLTVTQLNVTQPPIQAIESSSTITGSNEGLLGNITYATAPQQAALGASSYWSFTVVDVAVAVTLSLLTPNPLSSVQVFVSTVNQFPDATGAGSTWQLPQLSGQSSSSISILPTDPYFSSGGGTTLSMEGLYYITVFGQAAGSYSFSLTMQDVVNTTAPLMAVNSIYSGTLGPQGVFVYRFLCPSDSTTVTSDLVLTATNATVYVSDLTTTPGPGNPLNDITGLLTSSSLALSVLLVERGSAQLHAGVYYIAVYNPLVNAAVNYTISASFTLHVILQVNTSWLSDDPLLPGQLRYFSLTQQPGTTLNLFMDLATEDSAAYGSLYLNVGLLYTPSSRLTMTYPLPGSSSFSNSPVFYSIVGDGTVTGDQQGNYTYPCPLSYYLCVWQFTVYCPPTNALGMMNYSLTLSQSQLTQVVTPITPGNYTFPRPIGGFGTGTQEFSFSVANYSNVTVVVSYTTLTGNSLVITATRQASLVNQAPEFSDTAYLISGSRSNYSAVLSFNPWSAPFKPFGAAPNVGSSEIATWYLNVQCGGFGQCVGISFNYSLALSLTSAQYTYTPVTAVLNNNCTTTTVPATYSLNGTLLTNATTLTNCSVYYVNYTTCNVTSSSSARPYTAASSALPTAPSAGASVSSSPASLSAMTSSPSILSPSSVASPSAVTSTSLPMTRTGTSSPATSAPSTSVSATSRLATAAPSTSPFAISSVPPVCVSYSTNYTLVTGNLTTSSPPAPLIHVQLNATGLASVSIPAEVYAYYAYTLSPSAPGTQDLIFTATLLTPNNPALPYTQGGIFLYAALTPFPSQQSGPAWSTPTSTTPQSLIFSAETFTLQAGQTVYLGLFNPGTTTVLVNVTATLSTRPVLTPQQTSQYFPQSLPPGAAALFQLRLPGTANPLQFVSNSFVGGVTLSSTDAARVTMPPFIVWTSYIASTGTVALPTLSNLRGVNGFSTVNYVPRAGGYTSGDYVARNNERCSLATCNYYFLVVFPQGVNSGFTWSAIHSATPHSNTAQHHPPDSALHTADSLFLLRSTLTLCPPPVVMWSCQDSVCLQQHNYGSVHFRFHRSASQLHLPHPHHRRGQCAGVQPPRAQLPHPHRQHFRAGGPRRRQLQSGHRPDLRHQSQCHLRPSSVQRQHSAHLPYQPSAELLPYWPQRCAGVVH